jgi:hypothetical protein
MATTGLPSTGSGPEHVEGSLSQAGPWLPVKYAWLSVFASDKRKANSEIFL